MSLSAYNTIGIAAKPDEPSIRPTLQLLQALLVERGITVLLDEQSAPLLNQSITAPEVMAQQADLVIVVGGDGTLLGTGRFFAPYNVPLVGINLGRLGFLVDISPEEMQTLVTQILDGQFVEESRFLLEAEAFRGEQSLGTGLALNDVVLHSRNEIRMIEFTTTIDGKFVNTQRADGMIVSTPTGSTAYALSSGGPILHPSLCALALVPICPHTLSNRPLVINNSSRIEIALCSQRPVDSRVSFDGQSNIELRSGDRIIIQARQENMRLLHPQSYDYYHILRAKLHWGI